MNTDVMNIQISECSDNTSAFKTRKHLKFGESKNRKNIQKNLKKGVDKPLEG